jgi:hypothetical protein
MTQLNSDDLWLLERETKTVSWILVLLCMALVIWLRLLPLALSVTDDIADGRVQQRLYERLAQEVQPDLSMPQRRAQLALRVTQWMTQQAAQLEAEGRAVSQRLQSQWRYTAADGREYVYLGDFDSYLWLRQARNVLRTGTACDAVSAGECRDTYALAPVGTRMVYDRSLHTTTIVGLHKFMTLFRPHYPLPASAFLIPVLMGTLGVLPAFWIGRRLAGNVGGLFSAVLIGLDPTFLLRSLGSDNDVWNVVLPLYTMWAAIAALDAKDLRRQIGYGLLAGVCMGLHAWAWRGWLFFYAVFSTGLLGLGLLQSLKYALGNRTLRVWQVPAVRKVALVTLVFYVAVGLCTALTRPEESYVALPRTILAALVGGEEPQRGAAAGDAWPNTLQTVAELLRPSFGGVVNALGGVLFFCSALLGMLLLCLPQQRWRWQHMALLVCSVALGGYISTTPAPGRLTAVVLLALPLAAALLLPWGAAAAPDEGEQAAACLLGVWFLAALYVAGGAVRWLLLLVPPFSIAFAVTAGRLSTWVRSLTITAPPWYKTLATLLLGLVLLLLLFPLIQQGYATARNYTPRMHDAWWDTLTHVRDASAPEAIVNTWWDYGHWVKYVAERRVSSDGSTLLTHVLHWLGKAFVSPNFRQSLGILRMLNCGSDATPLPEGQQGAYGKLRAMGHDPGTAYAVVTDLVSLEKTAAQSYLAQRALSTEAQADLLRATHCLLPESYLILSSELLRTAPSWLSLGLWTPHGVPTVRSAAPAYLSPQWLPCRAADNQRELVCEMQAPMPLRGGTLEAFIYNPDTPADGKLRIRRLPPGGTADTTTAAAPALIILADAHYQGEVSPPSPLSADVGILVDLPQQRILVGTPPLLRSTFTHLLYLDGRYTESVEKFDDRTAETGERIVTWKIHWQGR